MIIFPKDEMISGLLLFLPIGKRIEKYENRRIVKRREPQYGIQEGTFCSGFLRGIDIV